MTDILYSDVRSWYVAFWRTTGAKPFTRDWMDEWWAWGGYRHVSAFGYSGAIDAWLHFNPQPSGIEIVAAREGDDAQFMISQILHSASVIKVERERSRIFLRRGPFTCVSAVSHLVGIPGGALTPWGLKKKLLAFGTEIPDVRVPDHTGSAA